MSTTTVEYSSQASEDFWAWMGPKVDAWDAENDLAAKVAGMAERDPEFARCTYGEEDVAFEVTRAEVVQVPTPTTVESELAIW